jgi:phage N-6-adenine-methyltransferase
MAKLSTKFGTGRQDWETPASIFDPLNDEFGFTIDVCATAENSKCGVFYSESDDALSLLWEGVCWMNPPFGSQGKWVKKAYEESQRGATVVCLLPARTNTNWWHDYVMTGEIRFIRGRPKFVGAEYGLPQPLAVVVFNPAAEEKDR